MEVEKKSSKPMLFLMWGLSVLGSWAVLPYLVTLTGAEVELLSLFLMVTGQSIILYGVICFLCSLILPKTDLVPFRCEGILKKIVIPGGIAGVVLGLSLGILDATVLKSSSAAGMKAPVWTGLLGSFYGAINEELLLRLFFFSLIYFVFQKVLKFESTRRLLYLWMTNIIVAIVFGVAHMPLGASIMVLSPFEILRILLLNGVAGMTFGWLYWSRGIFAAMFAHLITDFIIHGFLAF